MKGILRLRTSIESSWDRTERKQQKFERLMGSGTSSLSGSDLDREKTKLMKRTGNTDQNIKKKPFPLPGESKGQGGEKVRILEQKKKGGGGNEKGSKNQWGHSK